jgi:DNA repair protein RecO
VAAGAATFQTLEQVLHSIVLRRRDAGESDRRLNLLTRERGLVDVVAKGARKSGSRLAGASEPLSVSIFHIAAGKRQAFVTQAQPITSYPGLRDDYDRLTAAMALAEVIAATTPHERPEPELFGFAVGALRMIEVHEKPKVALAWSFVRLLEVTGHLPSFDRCAETGVQIQEAEPFFGMEMGGYVVADRAMAWTGRRRTKAEVLVGLAKLAQLELPPQNLRELGPSLRLLVQIWQELSGHDLPAANQVLA